MMIFKLACCLYLNAVISSQRITIGTKPANKTKLLMQSESHIIHREAEVVSRVPKVAGLMTRGKQEERA